MNKKQLGILRMATRQCGLSYRAACNRDIELVKQLKKDGYLTMSDNGKELSRFVFWATTKTKHLLEN